MAAIGHTSALFNSTPETAQWILYNIEQQFALSDETLEKLTKRFLEEFSIGLKAYNHPMAMIPTFVTGVPNGTETGSFLALDLGGTNLRVCEVELHGDNTFTLRQQKYKVSEALKTGEASALFDYLADSVDAFLTDTANASAPSSNSDAIPLGFTFSFPVEQTALDKGKILTWTKGFSAKNAIGNDVVQLLQDAFDRKHLHVKCVALVNDTVGTLLSRSYTGGSCILGAIFGTGTNGAYLEDVANIGKLGAEHPAVAQGDKMVVNTEWGAFDNARTTLPSTPYDKKVDRESINPTFQAFEKFISGMYLGEITRNVLLSLIDATPTPVLFSGKSTAQLNTHYGFDTAIMSEVEEAWEHLEAPGAEAEKKALETGELRELDDTKLNGAAVVGPKPSEPFTVKFSSDPEPKKLHLHYSISLPSSYTAAQLDALERIRSILVQRLGFAPEDVSLQDAAVARWVCALVADRAAKLSGCAVAAVLIQTGLGKLGGQEQNGAARGGRIGVSVDGSLIQHYPSFEARVRQSVRRLVGKDVEERVEIGLAKDGSGVGAALCALQAVKQDPGLLVNRGSSALNC